jgi:hypothetical protein
LAISDLIDDGLVLALVDLAITGNKSGGDWIAEDE